LFNTGSLAHSTYHTYESTEINFIDIKSIVKDFKNCKLWKDRFKITFGHLSWKPDYFQEESKNAKI
jgi:hypothetical protein